MKTKPGIWPPPVYEAHFADGTIGRCSFHSPAGKAIDFDYGKRVAASLYARPHIEGVALKSESRRTNISSFFYDWPPRAIVRAYVEHETIGRVEHTETATKPRKVSSATILAQARKALENGNADEALNILRLAA